MGKNEAPQPETTLPMAGLVGGPLQAALDVQKGLAEATSAFLQQVGTQPPASDDSAAEAGSAVFHYRRLAHDAVPAADGQLPVENVELKVPLLDLAHVDLNVPTIEQMLTDLYATTHRDRVTLGSMIGSISVTDANRARGFYAGMLGMTFVQDDGFAMVLRCGSNMVRLVIMPQVAPAQFAILGWESADLEADIRALAARGVLFVRYSFLPQDELDIWSAPDGSSVAWFKDPDGNTLSLSHHP